MIIIASMIIVDKNSKKIIIVAGAPPRFKAARERIRRIQLGLGPNDPLPEEAGPDAPRGFRI